jgi:hypothetical protein
MKLVDSIVNRNFVEADSIISETVELIMKKKLEEAKKMYAAKICEQPHMMNRSAAQLRRLGIVEEDNEPGEESSMARSELNAITKDAKNIMSKVKGNKELEAWTQSKITKAADYLNSVSDYMDEEEKVQYQNSDAGAMRNPTHRPYDAKTSPTKGPYHLINRTIDFVNKNSSKSNLKEEEQLDEARVKIIKARIRGGKIQRRKKVSNVPGMTLRGGKLQRMSPAERRRRKMGAKRAKIKRKSKMTRTLMKRQRSLRKRKALGL